ncbi:hypothetical protein L195_g036478 [Trifolium pratense]|uniref:Uncharacterized protein n=1 Tax=Trifolium pratense TaxID=57577 RepID=A0A2K3LPM9_TRIPR|nr:hypothetical protein L195_g036478 [Trifolium pratense]
MLFIESPSFFSKLHYPVFRPPPSSSVNGALRGGYFPPYPLFRWIMVGGCYLLPQESSEWEIMGEEIFSSA